MKPIIWVHGDNLSPVGPSLRAHPGAPAIWVWDDALLEEWQISTKRLVFIYECLLELPVVIRRGNVAEEVLRFATEHGATNIATAESPSPRFAALVAQMEAQLPVTVLPETPFVKYDGKLNLQRFSRYWRTAERYAFDISEGA